MNMIYNVRQPVYQQQQLSGGGGQAMKPNNAHTFVEKIIIGLDHAPPAFNLRDQLTGDNGANLQYIRKETGVNITLRGIGSMFIDPNTGTESQEPLHFFIEHQRYENLNSAKQLAKNLIETLQQEFLQFQQQQQAPALPQINIPPPSIINVPPPPIIQSNVMPPNQAQATNIIHQQFVTQNGIPIQMQQGNMVIQQQASPHNLNMPPPMKQIVQFHQPPPGIQTSSAPLQSTQATTASPIILNHQPQASIQYQYIQQPARDSQGNQLTLQQVYQQPQHIQGIQMQAVAPQQNLQQQQYITVQGNTAYMVPPPTIIQQTAAQPTQLSIIQHPPPLHMQLPAGAITVQAPLAEAVPTGDPAQMRNELGLENEEYSAEKSDECEPPNADEENATPTSESEAAPYTRTLTSVPPPQQQLVRQPPPPPMTHVPPPTITMSVPPPMNGVQQHIVGNTLYTTTTTNPGGIQQFQQQVLPIQQQQQTQQFIHTAPNGQNYVMNTATAQWQARAPQPTQFVTQQITAGDIHTLPPPVSIGGIPVSGAPVQQAPRVAVTFSQPVMQQQLQLQFQPQMMQPVQMPAQPATQQFNIIQTQPPPPQALLQQNAQQHHPQQQAMGLISVSQNGLHYTQSAPNAPPAFIQQQQQQEQIRPPPSYGEQIMVRSGQKRKSTSDSNDAPPALQSRMGVGTQRDLADFTIAPPPPPPPPTTSNTNLTPSGGVGIGQDNGPIATTTTLNTTEASNQQHHQQHPTQQLHTTQSQKPQQQPGHHPGYIGMMRYNSDVRRLNGGPGAGPPLPPSQQQQQQYTSGPPPPRGRMMYNGNYNSMRPPSQHEGNYRMGFAPPPPPYRGEGPAQSMNYGPRRMQR